MKFAWRKSGHQAAPTNEGVWPNDNGSFATPQKNKNLSSKPPISSSHFSSSSMPTRKQRMRLLKSIIHHADMVQNQFLLPGQKPSCSAGSASTSAMGPSSLAVGKSTVGNTGSSYNQSTKMMNDKTYQRWHQVLQEGLVPMAVHALGLLEKQESFEGGGLGCDENSSVNVKDAQNDEEEAYFATLEGMEEEIQVMAILARAAAFPDDLAKGGSLDDKGSSSDEVFTLEKNVGHQNPSDNIDKINDVIKCTSVLLFHIVLIASSTSTLMASVTSEANINSPKNKGDESNSHTSTVAGYDGRVRHVMKLACVDILSRAILESVDSFEKSLRVDKQCEEDTNESKSCSEKDTSPRKEMLSQKIYDIDDYSLWNISSIKQFLDQYEIGKDAVFGTFWDASSEKHTGEGIGEKKAGEKISIEKKEGTGSLLDWGGKKHPQQHKESKPKGTSEGDSRLKLEDELSKDEGPLASEQKRDPSQQVLEEVLEEGDRNYVSIQPILSENGLVKLDSEDAGIDDDSVEIKVEEETIMQIDERQIVPRQEEPKKNENRIQDRRRVNAKFLATRKFELVERLIAIDVVRFLMAEEREQKLREKEHKAQSTKLNVISSLLRKDSNSAAEEDEIILDDSTKIQEQNSSEISDPDAQSTTNSTNASEYLSASRIKQIKRGLQIAGVGVTLGTIFAVTGGLAAPALAAGIGGLTALTGAGTASSAAFLAVLATFKAGAALFGVGGGGIAAYKMKKRTEGLTEFEIRRENIEQYMYPGASEDKMKRGIEAMLPQLHTTVCVSGWLRENDISDFQLAWGIQPTCYDKKIRDDSDRIRQMKRFYSVYNPALVPVCEDFMRQLQKIQKKKFSWDRIWSQLTDKYGANPDHMLPIDKPYDHEIVLSHDEKEMIDGVLNKAKVLLGKRRGFLASNEMDFNENDSIAEFLAKVSPTKKPSNHAGDDTAEKITMESELGLCSAMEDSATLASSSTEADTACENDTVASDVKRETRITANKIETKPRDVHIDKTEDSGTKEHISSQQSPKSEKDELLDLDIDEEKSPIIWDWKRLYSTNDIHTLTWESKVLSGLCHIVENMAIEASQQATKAALQFSVVGAIISAVAIPSALATACKLIDDPYQIVVLRADEAGKELAKCLLQSDERRPVSLVGFSFGARVIFSCLRELARQQEVWEEQQMPMAPALEEDRRPSFLSRKSNDHGPRFKYDREPASLIADVIFIGLPRVIDKTALASCRRVTGGRFINCYARNDWLLSLMFLARGGTPCGTRPVDLPGLENFDVTNLVESHTKYGDAIPKILQLVRFCEP